MHPALFLEEILRIIFAYRYQQRFKFLRGDRPLADLVSLAGTCRTFKEPALDVLWMNLHDLSQLVRCLPSACRVKDLRNGKRRYALERDLEAAEIKTVKAYARRVRVLIISESEDHRAHLDPDTLRYLCRTSQNEPLFPKLWLLHLAVMNHAIPLLRHVAVPNLTDLTLSFSTSAPSSCEEFMRLLSSSSLAIQKMSIRFHEGWPSTAFSDIMNQHIRQWTHLQSMDCPDMSMDIDTFFHLSRTPSLAALSFTLGVPLISQIDKFDHIFTFPALTSMTLNITSMVPDSNFFTHVRLPSLATISVYYVDPSPSRAMIKSFAMALQTACNHELVTNINLDGAASWSHWRAATITLVLDDILPFAAFNLTQMRIELDWIVDLKDVDLLLLASDCPQIECLHINEELGWRSAGITPACLVEVLRRCPLLRSFSIVLDTHESQTLTGNGPVTPLQPGLFWAAQLADSTIEAESVPALAAFFADCMPSDGIFCFSAWDSNVVRRLRADWDVHQERWNEVNKIVDEIMLERSKGSYRPRVESF